MKPTQLDPHGVTGLFRTQSLGARLCGAPAILTTIGAMMIAAAIADAKQGDPLGPVEILLLPLPFMVGVALAIRQLRKKTIKLKGVLVEGGRLQRGVLEGTTVDGVNIEKAGKVQLSSAVWRRSLFQGVSPDLAVMATFMQKDHGALDLVWCEVNPDNPVGLSLWSLFKSTSDHMTCLVSHGTVRWLGHRDNGRIDSTELLRDFGSFVDILASPAIGRKVCCKLLFQAQGESTFGAGLKWGAIGGIGAAIRNSRGQRALEDRLRAGGFACEVFPNGFLQFAEERGWEVQFQTKPSES